MRECVERKKLIEMLEGKAEVAELCGHVARANAFREVSLLVKRMPCFLVNDKEAKI